MDTTSSQPLKRIRISENTNGQITECIREFRLPRQFPSMISAKSTNSILKGKYPSDTNVTKNIKLIPTKDANSFNKLKTLKIKSLDGKDLGEVNVQLVPQMGDTKVVALSKPGVFKNVSKPVSVSFVTNQEKSPKLLKIPQALPTLQISSIKSLNQLANVDNNSRNSAQKRKLSLDDKNNYGNNQSIGNQSEEIKNTNQSPTENVRSKPRFIPIRPKNPHMKVLQLESPNGNQKYIKLQNPKVLVTTGNCNLNKINSSDDIKVLATSNKFQSTGNVAQLKLQNVKSIDNKKVVESKSPIINCGNLVLTNINDKTSSTSEKQSKEKVLARNWSNWVYPFDANKPKNVENMQKNAENKCMPKPQSEAIVPCNGITSKSNDAEQKDSQNTRTLGKNVMVMVHNNESSHLNKNIIVTQNQGTNGKIQNGNVVGTVPNFVWCRPQINIEPKQAQDSIPIVIDKTLSDKLSIVEKALSSVEDDELRAKALKALADCGIGMERYVPISTPQNLKTVHDSKVQTDVFGLLDTNNFVLVRDDVSPLERIKQTERATLDSNLNNIGINSNYKLQTEESLSMPFPLSLDNDPFFGIHNILNELCLDNEGASKVQRALDKPQSIYKKISDQLQKDIDTAKKYDENGLLNIHKAVINDRINDVQRHLLILDSCKHSIDTPTTDGMTSLELAVRYNASPAIVKVLLENGASPVLSGVFPHDSALIIASRMSLPVLPQLVEYVSSPELLDSIDSEGFATLHYCAKNGNLDGVKALLEAGANINLKDNRSGRTALFHSLENNHIAVGQYLLDKGASATVANFSGQNVLSLIENVKNLTFKNSICRMIE